MGCDRLIASFILLLLALGLQATSMFIQGGWLQSESDIAKIAELIGLGMDGVSVMFLIFALCLRSVEEECCTSCKNFHALVQICSFLSGFAELAGEIYFIVEHQDEAFNVCTLLTAGSLLLNFINLCVCCCCDERDKHSTLC